MVGILAGTIYTVAINQLLYIEILEILGMILFFGSPIITLFWVFWVGTGTDSDDTGLIRHDSPWSSPRTDDCWGSCMDEVDRHIERMIESQDQAWREYQHEMQTQYREAEEKKMERERKMWEEMRREHEG